MHDHRAWMPGTRPGMTKNKKAEILLQATGTGFLASALS